MLQKIETTQLEREEHKRNRRRSRKAEICHCLETTETAQEESWNVMAKKAKMAEENKKPKGQIEALKKIIDFMQQTWRNQTAEILMKLLSLGLRQLGERRFIIWPL